MQVDVVLDCLHRFQMDVQMCSNSESMSTNSWLRSAYSSDMLTTLRQSSASSVCFQIAITSIIMRVVEQLSNRHDTDRVRLARAWPLVDADCRRLGKDDGVYVADVGNRVGR